MKNKDKRRSKRIGRLVVVTTLVATVLATSTYAWFIGMQTVNVSSFDITIDTTDSLLLSLDGATWDSTVTISESTVSSAAYLGNTNSWGGDGLFPVSSVGAMSAATSRMILFEKASFTATDGGYRVMASQVDNTVDEQDGYVAFDLFVKNFSGAAYITELNPLDEEAIYLTVDSEVTVGAAGIADTGIENSVRVAFAQIGRVVGTTDLADTITGITCSDDASVTGICRTAQIWEPNNSNHVDNAISYYDTSCVARVALDVTDPASYSGSCGTVIEGLSYPTYAVSTAIASSDNVDVYDGAEYNTYEGTTKLVAYDTFTDTEKLLEGTERPSFMTLAPNSITKLRIYVYIEGQDIDNYDFASIGRQIAVNFGFTKQRFTEQDIEYDGPDINQGDGPSAADQTAPVITLSGDNPMTVIVDAEYVDPGASALDNIDGDLTGSIEVINEVDTSIAGTYYVTYRVVDAAGNMGTRTRTVIVQ